jgi:rubrerythrin
MIYIERWKECLEKFIELTPEEKSEMLDAMETILNTCKMHRQAEDMKAAGIWHEDETHHARQFQGLHQPRNKYFQIGLTLSEYRHTLCLK